MTLKPDTSTAIDDNPIYSRNNLSEVSLSFRLDHLSLSSWSTTIYPKTKSAINCCTFSSEYPDPDAMLLPDETCFHPPNVSPISLASAGGSFPVHAACGLGFSYLEASQKKCAIILSSKICCALSSPFSKAELNSCHLS